jgi:hypothetical protein
MPIEMARESIYLQTTILVVLTMTGIQGMFSAHGQYLLVRALLELIRPF